MLANCVEAGEIGMEKHNCRVKVLHRYRSEDLKRIRISRLTSIIIKLLSLSPHKSSHVNFADRVDIFKIPADVDEPF